MIAQEDESISSKVLLENCNMFASLLQNSFNFCIETSSFPETLKKGYISLILKKGDDKKSNRTISVLPSLSKIFERLIDYQVKPYTNTSLNPLLCGFKEGHSTQHALLQLVKLYKKALDQTMSTGAIISPKSLGTLAAPLRLFV